MFSYYENKKWEVPWCKYHYTTKTTPHSYTSVGVSQFWQNGPDCIILATLVTLVTSYHPALTYILHSSLTYIIYHMIYVWHKDVFTVYSYHKVLSGDLVWVANSLIGISISSWCQSICHRLVCCSLLCWLAIYSFWFLIVYNDDRMDNSCNYFPPMFLLWKR